MTEPLEATAGTPDLQQRVADYAVLIDLLGSLPAASDEESVIDSVMRLFNLLCAPARFAYLPVTEGAPGSVRACPEDWMGNAELRTFATTPGPDYEWSASGNGFRLRVAAAGETLGAVELEGLSFPQYRTHYVNLALGVAPVCALAVRNARAHARLHASISELKEARKTVDKLNADLQVRIEQAESANKELEAFSYSVSHDLRAPLRHIGGFMELLQKHSGEKLDDKGKRYLSVVSDSARQMGVLIDDLLSFSRMGRTELTRAQVDLGALTREVVAAIEPDTRGREIEWRIGELPVVTGDRAMLHQVMANLVGNAVKYTRTRPAAVIEVRAERGNGEHVVSVRDNGVGFDMRYADKLFGVFQRLHGTTEFEGTGIGLANVRRIIYRHGGRTWAEGEVDRGATFSFSLPARSESQP